MWVVLLDMLAIAEVFRRREGEWPSEEQAIWEVQKLGFRWGGANLFSADFDATESLPDNTIIESIRLECRSPS